MKMHLFLALALALLASPALAQTNPGTSPLSVPKGGSGRASFTSNCIPYGAGTSALLCATSTANGVLIYNGSGVPTSSTTLPSGLVIPSPDINGGTADALTSLGIRSTGAAFDLVMATAEVFTGSRTLSWTLNDANRSISLKGDVSLSGNLTTSGDNAVTLTTTADTNVTLPTTGTLATLDGSETLTGKSIALGSNTISGTTAEFNAALSDGDFTTLAGSETLTNKTLTSPVINTATISGGTINNAVIGGTTPAAVTATALTATQTAYLTGVISPSQIAGNVNDYAPTGFSTASVLRLTSDASRNITGLAGGADGRVVVIHNIGSFDIVLTNQDTDSAEENRFAIGGDTVVGAGQSAALRYDGTSSRWRMVAGAGAGGGGGGSGTVTNVATGVGLQGGPITTSGTIEMSDQYRRNILIDRIHLSKALAEYQRRLNEFATGFKGASDALNGIASISGGNVTPAGGYAAPTITSGTVTVSGGNPPATSTSVFNNGLIYINRSTPLPNSVTIESIGAYSTAANTITMKIVKRNSSTNYDIVVSQTLNHPGGGWADLTLSSPFAVPASGTYYVGGFFTTAGSTLYNASQARTTISTDLGVGTGVAATEATDFVPSFRATERGLTNNMTLVTTTHTASATVSNGRVFLEYDDSCSGSCDSITLETDLNVSVTCDGTNWNDTVLSTAGTGQSGRKLAETADTSCGANTGTSFAAKITSANNKMFRIYGLTYSAR